MNAAKDWSRTNPSTRLAIVAAPIPPDDFNIFDISSFPKSRRKETLILKSFQ